MTGALVGVFEGVTIPLPSLFPQGLTVSNSTHNSGSLKARYGYLDIQARDYSHICIVH